MVWTCLRPTGDARETRENTREGAGGGNLNNRTVLGRHRGVRGEGIKSQKCASVPACQQFSKIYTCVRARVYLWKLLVRWYAGTPQTLLPKRKIHNYSEQCKVMDFVVYVGKIEILLQK